MGQEHENFIRSRTFSVGGHNWSIRFYPDGYLKGDEDHISVYLELMDKAKSFSFILEAALGALPNRAKVLTLPFKSATMKDADLAWFGDFMVTSIP
ncbi:TD and POZ domain-containing protein 4 [Panicum miliaceum]|uniref:TD and POZ domain-containing protein 4 n=1 Tax=Panicum miliaceum TaxID=4540 RepID=A0A3L6PMB7_PANMI|nr:TD and POZ domain-containing protein 4 [Panicum miliaceum]